MRVLVTGSRQFLDRALVYEQLDRAWEEALDRGEAEFTVVHGNAAGADTLANEWVWDRRTSIYAPLAEPHPVNWRPLGYYDSFAGHARNTEMVRSGIDLVLAFLATGAGNTGTRHCLSTAVTRIPEIERREFWS